MSRRRPAPRRPRYGHPRAPRTSLGGRAIAITAAAIVIAAVVGYLTAHRSHATAAAGFAAQLVYTERTANDAAITLPDAVQNHLIQIGLAHRPIGITRIGFTGNVTTSTIDMTPRTGPSSTSQPLNVIPRAVPVIDSKISAIEKTINSPATTAVSGGRALYDGLTKIDFSGAPVTIVSSGLDLANPDDFRSLRWSVPAGELVADLTKAGDLPALHGPVTFVLVPTTGRQPQLRQAQKDYLRTVWSALLTAAGATSVRFVDATGTTAGPAAPDAFTVPVPNQPPTVRPRRPARKVTCAVPASYFVVDTPRLIDPAGTERDLAPCMRTALAGHASFALDGWTSYEGPLNSSGRPAFNYPANRELSQARVRTIANLLVSRLGVPRSAITRMTGHGDFDQPFPGPASPANRVVIITYTVR